MNASAKGSGTREDPWRLKTPPGKSEFTVHRGEAADPPALVCTLGLAEVEHNARNNRMRAR